MNRICRDLFVIKRTSVYNLDNLKEYRLQMCTWFDKPDNENWFVNISTLLAYPFHLIAFQWECQRLIF